MQKSETWPPPSGVPAKSRFKKARKLKWGETPFDDLTRAELLRLVQAYHYALQSARSVMAMRASYEPSIYWSSQGSGGKALLKANHLMDLCGDGKADEASEKIYRSFFRTAGPLLFPHMKDDKFYDWGVNDKGEMIAPCPTEGGYRPIEWRDVCPQD